MVPSSLVGLLMFVVLLAPGFAYAIRRERSIPAAQESAFRETLQVIATSLICVSFVVVAFFVARVFWPSLPDVIGLIQGTRSAALSQLRDLYWWPFALLGAATILGFVAADPRLAKRMGQMARWAPARAVLGTARTDIQPHSAWYRVLHMHDDDPGQIHVGLELDNGAYVQGRLSSLNVLPEETGDRDILLHAPLSLRTTRGTEHVLSTQYLVASARHIRRMDVSHLREEPADVRGAAGANGATALAPLAIAFVVVQQLRTWARRQN